MQLDVGSGTAFFPDVSEKLPAVFFRYAEGWKARAYPDKHFVSGGGFKRSFWNLDRVLRGGSEVVYIVEGELDACALVEAGIPVSQVLGAHGAKDKPTEGDPRELAGYDYVEEALKAGLSKVSRFVWCGDGDGAGRILRDDMVKLLGAARFWFVEWPEGVKDANDMLLSDGAEALGELVQDGSLPWPVTGIYRLSELPEPSPMTLWNPGFDEWERKVLLAPRTLSVVTGHPGHGKTALWNQLWFNVIKRYEVGFCGASFETRPKPHVRRQLRTLINQKLERDMTDDERANADAWINERYFFLVHQENRPTLEWFLEMAEVAVIRHGVRIVQADPWNRFESSRGNGERDDEYVLRCLRTLYQFATDMNCHVQVLAHPAKMEGPRRGQAPTLEDIAGAKHWDNVCDQGFTVHRPKMYEKGAIRTECQFYHRKARFDELGYACRLSLDFKRQEGKYVSVDYEV
ncbi:MAG TPA: DnaB-like helicase C-terminal domain-containing protein [Bradyrhizobium sp.]|nr:DnaB-like helicase C-terminal domain-containing protein [Bradyrhizobium sp.]